MTVYEAVWERIVSVRPDLDNIDYDEVWGKDPKHVWSRVDPARLNIISLMKALQWTPGEHMITGSRRLGRSVATEAYWKAVMDTISFDGLQEFANWAIENSAQIPRKLSSAPMLPCLSEDEVALLASMPIIQKQAPAQWGTW